MNNGIAASFQDNAAHGEDAFFSRELSSTSYLDAVLDGVTHCQGAYASNFTAQMLQDALIEKPSDVIKVLEEANSILYQSGMGRDLLTTVSIALKTADELTVINVGDSPIYLVRNDEVEELTVIPKSVLLPGVVSGAVGAQQQLRYSSKTVTLQPGDRLFLATDGLANNFFPEELARIVADAATPQGAISTLKQLIARKRELHVGRHDTYGSFKEDDQTAIVRYLD